jgi:hypothetical protein
MIPGSILLLTLRSLSEPLDAGSKVEVKFDVQAADGRYGELYLRVLTSDASGFAVGDIYTAKLIKLP